MTNERGGFERAETWFGKRVQAFGELRTKVDRLEAEVEAGRRERLVFILIPSHNLCNNLHLSSGPIDPRILLRHPTHLSKLRNPSDLRLVHARLLEDHNSTTVLLRQRETDIADLDQQVEAQETILP